MRHHAFVIAGLIAWIVLDGREQQRRLADFEARGGKRRAGQKPAAAGGEGAFGVTAHGNILSGIEGQVRFLRRARDW